MQRPGSGVSLPIAIPICIDYIRSILICIVLQGLDVKINRERDEEGMARCKEMPLRGSGAGASLQEIELLRYSTVSNGAAPIVLLERIVR